MFSVDVHFRTVQWMFLNIEMWFFFILFCNWQAIYKLLIYSDWGSFNWNEYINAIWYRGNWDEIASYQSWF